MNFKQKSRLILCLSILLSLSYVEYKYWTTDTNNTTKTVASGVVQSKFESDYACGTKGRYVCYARYLEINNVNTEVNLDTFTKTKIGDYVTLNKSFSYEYSGKDILILFIHVWLILSLALGLIFIVCHYISWACFCSDKVSCKDYFIRLYSVIFRD